MVTAAQHQAALDKQKQTQAANAVQSSAFWALRAGGKAEAAAQMSNPISTQTYNIRGEEIIVLGKGIKSEARIAAEKRSEEIQAELQYAQSRNAQMISVYDNSTNLPRNDSQSQTVDNSPTHNSISNNVVNPSSLFPNQSINVTGQSQNSTMDYGVNTNANYNYATAMNDYQSANPNQSINAGQANPAYYTAGLSSIPYNNETNTDLLGGDIQHQETDINTNLEYEKSLANQSQSNVNWADRTSLGITTAIGASIAGLYLWGKNK